MMSDLTLGRIFSLAVLLVAFSPQGQAQCPPNYDEVSGHCYTSHCPKLSWHAAHDYCEKSNGTLVIINSLKEGAILLEWLKSKGIVEPFWTGLVGVDKPKRQKRDLSHYQCVLKGNEDFECFRPGKAIVVCEHDIVKCADEGHAQSFAVCNLACQGFYSNVPSDNLVLFEEPGTCRIKKPDRWDEWIEYYFGNNSIEHYYGDSDMDGLVNILEYYAGDVNFTKSSQSSVITGRKKRQTVPINEVGLDPTNADTDSDQLNDGFECYYGLNPKVFDNNTADFDNDQLLNYEEQALSTDPNDADSDGDGISDSQEAASGTNPLDPNDFVPDTSAVATISVQIGDPSGSRSERYFIYIGPNKEISHHSPQYGVVATGQYTIGLGRHPIWIEHIDSRYTNPDYDYQATITPVAGANSGVTIRVEDPENIMGVHHESYYFFADGKFATLIVERNCTGNSSSVACQCQAHTSCSDCFQDQQCIWRNGLCKVRNGQAVNQCEESLRCAVGSCDFYQEVENIVSCGSGGYALSYGKPYCELYQTCSQNGAFSQAGMEWINKTRDCLQETLIPEVCKSDATCTGIRNFAFNSQSHCQECAGLCTLLANQQDFMGLMCVFSQSPDYLLAETQALVRDTASRCPVTVQEDILEYLKNVTSQRARDFFAGWMPPYPPYPQDWTYPLL